MPLYVRPMPPRALSALNLSVEGRVCVAIPARNEAERIGACLKALFQQTTATPFDIFVFVNNSDDATAAIVAEIARDAAHAVHLCDATFPASETPAAHARRLSVNGGMEIAGADGVVLMTDADSIVDPDWVGANLAALAEADIICGAISPDLMESVSLPEYVLQRGVQEFAIEQAQCETECLLDDLSHDSWPRHRTESAASLACTTRILLAVDSVPIVEPGEDKELVARVRRAGGRVRHSYAARVSTSCRLDGRARGGWADDLHERVHRPDAPCHANLEPSRDHFRRTALRAALRADWPRLRIDAWASRLRIAPDALEACLGAPSFEAGWAEIEMLSPRLARRRIVAADLGLEIARARRLLERAQAGVAARDSVVRLFA